MWGQPAAALGRRVRIGTTAPWSEIVGVAGDVCDDGVQTKATATVYWPAGPLVRRAGTPPYVPRAVTFAIRSDRTGTESFLQEIRQAVWSVNASVPLAQVRTLGDVYNQSLARTSFTLVMLAIAGGLALILGIIGIYGVLSYAVSERSREIGVRMALGAPAGELQRMFVRYGLALVGIGVLIGLAAAAGLTRLMSSLLFKTSPLDPVTYAGGVLVLVTAAALASYLPARRASRVDPMNALRQE
jgi:predicted lysophospholipase L1 biosynthesis ABC-type transport system permease subunit